MKYFRITADYRPNNPNKPTYDFICPDSTTRKEIKQYFITVYSWLTVYGAEEILQEDLSKWAIKLKEQKIES